jgi:5-methylcytosine-specific restriction protein B
LSTQPSISPPRIVSTAETKAQAEVMKQMPDPTNLILYGPPGTGKTYRTAREAVRLCGEAIPADRAQLMARYEELRAEGRIEFVTFHQNFSYEDFVEGLRPETGEGAGFSLQPHDGVFAKLVKDCLTKRRDSKEAIKLQGRSFFKMSLGEAGKSEWNWVFEQALEEGYIYLGFGNIDWTDERYADKSEILKACEHHRGELGMFTQQASLSLQSGPVKGPDAFRNKLKTGDIVIVSKGLQKFRAVGLVTGGYEYAPTPSGHYCHRRKVQWLWSDPDGIDVHQIADKQFSIESIYQLYPEKLKLPALQQLVNTEQDSDHEIGEIRPHVLVIDEINRANVSKVFGELITLIEPDKRLGMANALEVRLPYSKRLFGVPANLHIIGTMNTADRSIALLDTALRRRFRFEEIAPDPMLLGENVGGVDLRAVLGAINDRIEYLIDRDHRIGHAFFIDCATRADIDAAMRDKVIPLLQEYFFDDWGRIAAVVGEGFLKKSTLKPPPGLKEHGGNKSSWQVLWPFHPDAYAMLLGKAAAPDPLLVVSEIDEAGEDAAA